MALVYQYSSVMGTKHAFADEDGGLTFFTTDQVAEMKLIAEATQGSLAKMPADMRSKIDDAAAVISSVALDESLSARK